jgi:hypothetical protein
MVCSSEMWTVILGGESCAKYAGGDCSGSGAGLWEANGLKKGFVLLVTAFFGEWTGAGKATGCHL